MPANNTPKARSFADMDILVTFTEEQKSHLLELNNTGQYADGYRYIRDIVYETRVAHAGKGSPLSIYLFGDAKAKELIKLEAWIGDVVGINAGDGSLYSEFVRGSTRFASLLRGSKVSEAEFQVASDNLASKVILDAIEAGGMPGAGDVVALDVSEALANLGLPTSGWAGIIGDIVPPPFGFGENYVKFPKPSEVGLVASVGGIVGALASNIFGATRFLGEVLSGNPQSIVNTLDLLLKGIIDVPTTGRNIKGSIFSDFLLGGNGNDYISGGRGNDTLFGKDGDDILDGGTGRDKMYGGGNNDTYIVDNVGDRVFENYGEGIDTVRASVSYTLSANVENLVLVGNNKLNGVGNELNNVMVGNDNDNVLYGMAGDDEIHGGGGNDYISGGLGNDHLSGGEGNDVLMGDAGDDVLVGGLGADTLYGGAGHDIFAYVDVRDSLVDAADLIMDFKSGEDIIDLSGLQGSIPQSGEFNFGDTFDGSAGQIVINYSEGSNTSSLMVDFGGDGVADFLVNVVGKITQDDIWTQSTMVAA